MNKVPTGNFIQNGDGNHNFLKNEAVNVHYNPLETLKEFMTTTLTEIKSSYEETKSILIERNQQQEKEIEGLKKRIRELEG
ncbi:MAG: hypothetical protein LIP01_05205 [Tannerellaceae bacterium]|nr:hypothetical protein [Tannerellaceae bacterium]